MALLAHYGFCIDDNDADQAVTRSTEPVRVRRDLSDPFAQIMLLEARATGGDETAARAALAEAARAGMARFPTPLAKDEALLATTGLATDGPAHLFA